MKQELRKQIDNIVQVLTDAYRVVVDKRTLDTVALNLCYDRDFCGSIGMDYSKPDYPLIKLALLSYMGQR